MSKTTPTRQLVRRAPGSRPKLRRGVGYVRVSRVGKRDKDSESFISPNVQRATITRLAKAKGIRIVAWYEDLNQSGGTADRPAFQQAIAAIENGEADALLVARMSRFARSVLNAKKALDRIEGAGGQLLADDLNLDASTPEGRMMRDIFFAVAEWELEVAREQAREAQAHAHARGVKIGKVPPGLRRNADEDGVLADSDLDAKALVPDEERAPLVAAVFTRRANGAPWSSLTAFWHGETGERISRQRLADMIRNRVYIGDLVNGGGRVTHGAVEALVSPEIWEAAQSTHVAAPRPSRDGNGGSLLAGILTCASCGGRMTAASLGAGRGKAYRCQNSAKGEPCSRPQSVKAELADPVIEERFLAWAKEQAKVEGNSRGAERLDAALVAEEQAEAELVAMIDASSASRNPELFKKRLTALEDTLDAARERVAELRASGQIETHRVDAVQLWPDLSVPERRKLLAAAVERAEVHAPEGRSARGVPFADRLDLVFAD